MQTPEDVAQMLRLKAAGLSIKHVARQMGCSKNTVRRYLRGGGWAACKRPERRRTLRGLEPWLGERLQQHRGTADVVRQDLEREHGVRVSLRTVERAVLPSRRELCDGNTGLPFPENRHDLDISKRSLLPTQSSRSGE